MERELEMALFDDRARQALSVARSRCERSARGLFDSSALLLGLAEDVTLWRDGDMRRRLCESVLGPAVTETTGQTKMRGLLFSREAETVLTEAVHRAHANRRGEASAEDVLWALSQSGGSDATALLRSVSGAPDPWREQMALTPAPAAEAPQEPPGGLTAVLTGASGEPKLDERLVAFIYILLRDEVVPGKLVSMADYVRGLSRIEFQNDALEALARDVVSRITSTPV